MATHRIPILGPGTAPDETGEVFFEPYSVKATNKVWARLVAIFNEDAGRNGLQGGFAVPKNYVDTANLVIVWTSASAIANGVVWDFDYRAVGGNDSESLDQAGSQESVEVRDVAPSAVNERMEVSIALTDGNFAADDTVLFEFFRDGTDATLTDDLVGAAILFDLYFEYNDA